MGHVLTSGLSHPCRPQVTDRLHADATGPFDSLLHQHVYPTVPIPTNIVTFYGSPRALGWLLMSWRSLFVVDFLVLSAWLPWSCLQHQVLIFSVVSLSHFR